ncbi:fructoselysine 6-kinase [Paenibacillus sp. JX-17]|uniref:Fructoselysine 6-kinase n=1 Tax=Paenibacillus lacisoli TaxID=3064525 RepID=A0ABT9CE47_9BACL|nr:fructoselysine 6-kinase [Paenibacillus sp. JX-17]MDO7907135.1 fructoselysine 6-kinase [Paenibacillus sp. JX-17]
MVIASVGDNCMDLYENGSRFPGGNAVNVAVWLSRLGSRVSYTGWIGSDEEGQELLRRLSGSGIDLSHMYTVEGRTATTQVNLIQGERTMGEYHQGVMSRFKLTEEDLSFLSSHRCIHSVVWGHCHTHFPYWKERGLDTSFDFSDRFTDPLVKELAPVLDYAFFSYSKDDSYIRNFMTEMCNHGTRNVIVTLGANGSMVYNGRRFIKRSAIQTVVVDTLGAGDSFIAGYLHVMMAGGSIRMGLEKGSRCAAATIGKLGAW